MASQVTVGERTDICFSRSLAVLDSIWAVVVCLPALCLYWRGCFSLMDHYILPQHIPANYWLMTVLGCLKLVTFWLLEPLDAYLRHASRVKYVIVTRLLLIYHGWLFMFYWWGVWRMFDHYIGTTPVELAGCLFVSLGSLLLLGCTRSVMFPPYYIKLDTRPNLFEPENRFRTTVGSALQWRHISIMVTSLFAQQLV